MFPAKGRIAARLQGDQSSTDTAAKWVLSHSKQQWELLLLHLQLHWIPWELQTTTY